ncbi:hypothetical protein J7337_008160 [Fusarium musae]|uniref:Uncharacterized protein n=1 Tax=Fusarium musae TaxID=1042133 RepID=A0A9P8ILY4_9HYPO|nr:hypothetical protein J7337_008160 [Fusarium musae]KAG9499701.1 hypothetical protein J7337_008160 [Fusarium musae]
MEIDGAEALPSRPKHPRAPEEPGIETESPSKRQASKTSAVIPAPVVFPWRTCHDEDDVNRLKIKEKAVQRAEEECRRIRGILDHFLKTNELDRMDAIIMGKQMIEHWITEHDRIRRKHQNLRILVGVEGPTGAGKSSFLGSLLGISELFPSGQEAAATAVVGKVSWNWVDAPGFEFRAKVIFRNKADVERDLENLLQDLNQLSSLLVENAENAKNQGGLAKDQADSISVIRSSIEHQLPKVNAVWGFEEAALAELARPCPEESSYSQMVQNILNTNPKALHFLNSGIERFNASKSKDLADAIKPFLDSTPGKHGGFNQFSAWPLVKEVRIYTKADILKTGITLVDLPGCGDVVESRSEVAGQFSNRLDVRLVVSPIIRATDEKQGQALMRNGFDEAQMKISGKLNGHGFCVIMSKMDEMKVDTYISQCPDLHRNQEVIQKLNELANLKQEKDSLKPMHTVLKENKKTAEKQRGKAQKAYDKAIRKHEKKLKKNPNGSGEHLSALRIERDQLAQAFERADNQLKQHEARKTKISKDMSSISDWLHHRSVQTRNARVIQRIRADFARRQRNMGRGGASRQHEHQNEYQLPILPVSTHAFWQLHSGDTHMAGFPSLNFTGVPFAGQWLHRATLSKREKHLDEVLEEYQNLFTMMQIYSSPNGLDGKFNFTREQVEEVLAETHKLYTQKLGATLRESCAAIQRLNPLELKDEAKQRFLDEALRIVQKWSYKFPDDEHNIERMHWCTYMANLNRDGLKFSSYATGVTYTWMEHLVEPIMKSISNDWDDKINKRLPTIKSPMILGYSQVFTQYLNELNRLISDKVPSLAVSFSNVRPILENSQRATELKVRDALSELSNNIAHVASVADVHMAVQWRTTFRAALLDTGIGSYQRRQDIIEKKIKRDVKAICQKTIKRLETGVEEQKALVPKQMSKIVTEEMLNVKQQMSFLVNNLVENFEASPEKAEVKTNLQQMIRHHVEAWEAAWAQKGNYGEHILDLDLSIPTVMPEPVDEENASSETSETEDDSSSEDEIAASDADSQYHI